MSVLRDAATVALLRDTHGRLEVFLLKRHPGSRFMGGSYVFPGGALDEDDTDLGLLSRCQGVTLHEAAARMSLAPEHALGHWCAALRETFEESGILFAGQERGEPDWASDGFQARLQRHRLNLLDGSLDWGSILVAEDLRLRCDALVYFAHWITPEGVPKRFNTRFFVARAPERQVASACGQELVEGRWITPNEALAAHARGDMPMLFPTQKTLQFLSGFQDVQRCLDACMARDVMPCQPRIVSVAGVTHFVLPGDAHYEDAPSVAFEAP